MHPYKKNFSSLILKIAYILHLAPLARPNQLDYPWFEVNVLQMATNIEDSDFYTTNKR